MIFPGGINQQEIVDAMTAKEDAERRERWFGTALTVGNCCYFLSPHGLMRLNPDGSAECLSSELVGEK